MIFTETRLKGAYLVHLEKKEDHRGFNARAWCAEEFAAQGLMRRVAQTNIIFNPRKGTLRGLHFQVPPFAEAKLFRCVRGAMYDVIVDLRPESPTYRQWASFELTPGRYELLYVPEGFGQGFLTLADDTEVLYQVSQFYSPSHGRGFRYDDPAVGIEWPIEITTISEQDRAWPALDAVEALAGESGRTPR